MIDRQTEAAAYTHHMPKAVVLAALFVYAASSFAADDCPLAWTYCDANQWPALCQAGTMQSPVDLTAHGSETGRAIELHYETIAPDVKNTSRSYKIVNAKGSIEYNDVVYPLIEFHFHVPGEHTLEGVPAPMELHFVHGRGGKAEVVVGVLYKDGRPVEALSEIVKVLPARACDHAVAKELKPATLLPEDQTTYYRYRGSLTTPSPDCAQGLIWLIFADRANSTPEQREALTKSLGPNARQSRAAGPGHRVTLVTVASGSR